MAQIQGIRIKNYKALKDITLGKLWNNSEQPLTQLTAVIGKNGSMIKKIGTEARLDIKKFLGCGVHLDLFVKVEENWRNKKFHLKEFGFANDDM